MRYEKIDGYYVVVRITGPTHNMLQLKFSQNNTNQNIEITRLPISSDEKISLDSIQVEESVKSGVIKANNEFGISVSVSEMRFAESDSRPESIYSELAYELLKHFVKEI